MPLPCCLDKVSGIPSCLASILQRYHLPLYIPLAKVILMGFDHYDILGKKESPDLYYSSIPSRRDSPCIGWRSCSAAMA